MNKVHLIAPERYVQAWVLSLCLIPFEVILFFQKRIMTVNWNSTLRTINTRVKGATQLLSDPQKEAKAAVTHNTQNTSTD